MDPGSREPGLDEVIASGAVRSVYQPVVALETGAVVGWEALARGPSGSALEHPDALFAAAGRAGRLEELDWVCRKAAVEGALAAGLDAGPTALFINVEPATLGSAPPPGLAETFDRAAGLRIVLEVTERAILTRPAALLAAVQFARERGWGMALDDVGVNPESLAMVPFVRPDVVKLDMSLVQCDVGPDLAYVATAVMAYAERTGAAILAEGIETPAHLERARTLGATLGQGWHFGRPVDRPVAGSEGVSVAAARATSGARTPVEAVRAAGRRFQTGPKSTLLAISQHLETEAMLDRGRPVLLAGFQHSGHFTGATSARYRRLAEHCSLVAVLGSGLAPEPVAGVRGAELAADDPLVGEWSVVVVGPRYTGALVARDLGDDLPEAERRFEFAITHDPVLVQTLAEALMRRVYPSG